MFKDKASEYCFFNNSINLFDDVNIEKFQSSSELVYEVIRIIDGKPLFWKEHIERIYLSFEKIKGKLEIDKDTFENGAKIIIEKDQMLNNNIKIVVGKFNGHINILIYNIKSNYPSEKTKADGVKIKAFNYERLNPGAKIINLNYKKEVTKFINDNDLFEALLVDKRGLVTEGSRSNVFFIKNEIIYTPKSSGVLLGITRMKLLELFEILKIEVLEIDISLDSIDNYDGVFISGTSLNAISVNSIGEKLYKTSENETYKLIQKNFDKMILKNIYWG